ALVVRPHRATRDQQCEGDEQKIRKFHGRFSVPSLFVALAIFFAFSSFSSSARSAVVARNGCRRSLMRCTTTKNTGTMTMPTIVANNMPDTTDVPSAIRAAEPAP